MASPSRLNGEALVTLPGTSTAFTQPNPSPVTTLSSTNTATETANDAKAYEVGFAYSGGRMHLKTFKEVTHAAP